MLLCIIPSFIIEGHIKFQLGVGENEDAFYFPLLNSWPSWLEASAFSLAVVQGAIPQSLFLLFLFSSSPRYLLVSRVAEYLFIHCCCSVIKP